MLSRALKRHVMRESRALTPAALTAPGRRGRRVVVLLFAIILFSLGDLVLTIAHLRSTGMVEANPIAAYILVNSRSLGLLTTYKLATVAISVLLLYQLRRHVQGEVAAWIAACILLALSYHWNQYAIMLDDIDPIKLAQAEELFGPWMILD
jgi:Domain of unknown function (DUF5658)